MSRVIEEQVVEMRFDNQHFEKNIQGTLSTLDKFKEKLRFDGATKGLENINNAASKVDMSPMSRGLEAARVKFSALEVMGVTALANLTNSALNAGKRIAASLTIEPIKTGFNEYELKMSSVQTIMASTGESLETVNKYLEELNAYSDQTIYSFSDMTQNIGKFTNAGVKLEDAVMAIKGISNAAALSGANTNEASRAMYNFAQALSAGYVKLIDWKSIELANMATVGFKEQLIQAAVAAGTLTKTSDGMYKTLAGNTLSATKNFNESLQDQWMTTDVLIGTLKDYSDETTEIGAQATQAATEVKTFSQMLDTLKESAQSGWAQTWEIIFGDFYEGKELWTSISNAVGGVIDTMTKARNNLLEGALSYSPLGKLSEKLKNITDTMEAPIKKLEEYDKIVTEIIRGDWGNGQIRFDKLTEAGYDWAHAQNLVNEKLGSSVRHATKLTDAQKEQTKQTVELTDAKLKDLGLTEEEIKTYRELEKESKRTGKSIDELIKTMNQKDGRTLLLESFSNVGSALLGTLKALKEGFTEIFPPMTAIQLYNLIDGFNKLTSHLRLTDAKTGELNETGEKLKRTFKGIFAALDIVLTVTSGPLKIAFKILTQLLGAFNLDILDVTAKIGDAIVAFNDWLDSVLDFTGIFEKLAPYIIKARDVIKSWTDSVKDAFTSMFDKIQPTLDKFIDSIQNWASDLKERFGGVASNILDGLKNGLKKGASTVWDTLVNIGKTVIDAICNILGIHSPSTVMEEVGENTIQGFINGISKSPEEILTTISNIFKAIASFFPQLKILNQLASLIPVIKDMGMDTMKGFVDGLMNGASAVYDTISEIVKFFIEKVKDMLGIHSPSKVFFTIGKFLIAGLVLGIVGSKTGLFDALKNTFGPVVTWVKEKIGGLAEYLGNIKWPEIKMEYILGAGALVGLVLFVKKLLDISNTMASGVESFGKGVKSIGDACKRLTNGLEPVKKGKWDSIANNALKLAAAIAILAGSVYILAQLNYGKVWSSVGAIVVLAGVVIALGAIIKKMGAVEGEFGKFSLMLVAISASLWIMASAIKKMEFLNKDNIGYILGGAAAMIVGLTVILAVLGKLVKGKTAQNIDKAGVTILKISAALLLMTFVVKQIGKIDEGVLKQGGIAIAAFVVIIAGLIWATQLAGKKIDAVGPTILKISAAMLLMAFTAKILGKMDREALIQGGVAIIAFGAIITGLIWATKLAGNNIKKVGSTILAVSGAMALMAVTVLICSMMSEEGFKKGIGAIAAFAVIVAGLIWATKLATEKELKGVARTILAMSLAIGIMGLVAVILSMISIDGLKKGVGAVAILGIIMTAMIWATRGASECQKNITAMAIAIGVMAAAVVALSFIKPDKLWPAVAAIGILMSIFTLMIKVAGTAQKAIGNIIVMTLAVGALAGLIYLLSKLPTEKAIGSAIALGGLTLALTVALAGLALVGKFGSNALKGALLLTALAIPLYLFVEVLKSMAGVENAIGVTNALLNLAIGMTLVLGVLTIIGLGGAAAIIGVGSLLALAVPLWVFIQLIKSMEDIPNAMTNVNALVMLMGTLTDMLLKLAIVAPLALIGVTAMAALEALMVATGVMAVAVGALMEKFPALQTFLDSGIEILKRLAGGIGEIISSFAVGLTSGLPDIATNLSDFMSNLSGFISGANAISDDLGDKIITLSKAILLLTAADLIAGISSFIQNGSSFADLGSDLSAFMMNAMPFIAGLSLVKPESLTAVKALAEAILILTAADLLDGLLSWLTGGSSLADFGKELAAFGPYMATYAAAVAGIDGASVEASANAAKALAEMAAALPNSGGVVGWFSGENDMATFGTQLVAFGTALKLYSIAVTGIAIEPINASVEAGKKLAEMAESIPNLGGVVSWFTGDNDLATFGTQIVAFGAALKSYSIMVTGIAIEPINASVEAGKALAGLNESIPNLGGVVSWFTGDNGLEKFGEQIVSFGTSLKDYALTVEGINVGAITLSVAAARQLSNLANALPTDGGFWSMFKDDTIDFEDFAKQIKKLGKGMVGYSESVSGLNPGAVSSSITSAKRLVSLIKSMDGLNASGVEAFSSAIGKLGKASVDKFVKAFTSSTSKLRNIGAKMVDAVANGAKSRISNLTNMFTNIITKTLSFLNGKQSTFKMAGTKLMTAFVNGVNAKKASVNTAMKTAVSEAVKGARSKYTNFYKAGSYVVSGFVKGINDNQYKATNAGTALGKAAYKAAKAAIESNSPSKKFMELGMYADQGLAKGLEYYAYLATQASSGLGLSIVEAMQNILGIHSPAKVVKDEVGRYIVQGLAEGITKDMSAEEAAAQKAKNIVNAFKEALDEQSLDMTTADLEFNLWSAQNPNATSAEVSAKQMETILAKIASQTEIVALAQAEYTTTLNEFGANATETQEAYNKLLQEQIDLADLTSEVETYYNDALKKQQQAQVLYNAFIRENKQGLLDLGLTMEEIQQLAREETGYDPELLKQLTSTNISDLIAGASTINSAITTGVASGISNSTTAVAGAVQTVGNACVNSATTQSSDWIALGKQFVESFAKGVKDNIKTASDTAIKMVTSAYQAAVDYLSDAENGDAVFTPTISPVLDMTNIQNGVSQLNGLFANCTMALADINVRLSNDNMSELHSIADEMKASNEAKHTDILNAIKNLRGEFDELAEAIDGMYVRLDGGAIVGEITGRMDNALGQLANHKERGN